MVFPENYEIRVVRSFKMTKISPKYCMTSDLTFNQTPYQTKFKLITNKYFNFSFLVKNCSLNVRESRKSDKSS